MDPGNAPLRLSVARTCPLSTFKVELDSGNANGRASSIADRVGSVAALQNRFRESRRRRVENDNHDLFHVVSPILIVEPAITLADLPVGPKRPLDAATILNSKFYACQRFFSY